MSAGDEMQDSQAVDRAMNQVLAAEQEAREAVEQCRAEAAQILAEAEQRARRVGRSTERRIRLIHQIADRAVDLVLEGLDSPGPGQGPGMPQGKAREVLDRAVNALVDEIIGGSP